MKHFVSSSLTLFVLSWLISRSHTKPASSTVVVPLMGGAELGWYYINVSVGTPFQNLTAVIDTSVMGIALPSYICVLNRQDLSSSCERGFNWTVSSTSSLVPYTSACKFSYGNSFCGYQYTYPDKAIISGVLITDTLNFLNNYTFSNFTFQTFDVSPTHFFTPEINGVFGMGFPQSTLGAPESALNRWFQDTQATDKVFSLCLGEFGGQMVLGGSANQFIGSPMQYVGLIPLEAEQYDYPQYSFDIIDITINGRSALDSGNTQYARISTAVQSLLVPSSTFASIRAVFEQLFCTTSSGTSTPIDASIVGICGEQTFFDGYCFVLDDRTIKDKYPTIALVLSLSVSLFLPPSNYFVDSRGRSCLAIEVTILPHITIGTRVMQEYYTVIDLTESEIGFAKAANCSGALYLANYVSGEGQKGTVGTKLKNALAVRVTDFNGKPVKGLAVTFSMVDDPNQTAGDRGGVEWAGLLTRTGKIGTLSPEIAFTDSDGVAISYITLGTSPGKNIVSADIPYCLNHVIFTAIGHENIVWPVLWFLTLAVLVAALVLLSLWYRRAQRKKGILVKPIETLRDGESTENEELEWGDDDNGTSINGSKIESTKPTWVRSLSTWFNRMRKGTYKKLKLWEYKL